MIPRLPKDPIDSAAPAVGKAQSRREFLTTIALAAGSYSILSAAERSRQPPISIDLGRQLLVDDLLIAATTLNRVFHRPSIHPASPVLKPETPIELNNGIMPAACPFSDGVVYDPKDKLFKMWYIAGYDDGFGYATSEDGIRWHRPMLDVVPGTNRVLAPIAGYVRNGSTVWLDHEANDPMQRFKMFAYFRRGNGQWPRLKLPQPVPPDSEIGKAYTSPDGIHWSEPARTGPCGDNSGMFYNPFRKKWVYNIRTRDRTLDPQGGRTRSYYEAHDFMKDALWRREDIVPWLAADERDLPDPVLQVRPELYKVDCVAYESRMLGLFGIFYGPQNAVAEPAGTPKTNDLQLGFSRDGIKWDRPDRTAFIPCSRQAGTWNRGYMHPAGGVCLVVGDQLRFYVSGFSGESPRQGGGIYAGASTGLATLRRDGFASLRAKDGTGTLTTRLLEFSGSLLFVNANMKGGALRVEVLDERDAVIAPFSKENCDPIATDRTKHPVRWKEASDLAALANRAIKLRFHVTNGDLYSFWVSRHKSGASHGYVAAGGPGFIGATDTTGA